MKMNQDQNCLKEIQIEVQRRLIKSNMKLMTKLVKVYYFLKIISDKRFKLIELSFSLL